MLNNQKELIERCIKRDRKAQNELHRTCYQALIPVCWRYSTSKEQAVEYFNSGFIKILFGLKKYKTEVPFELWSRRVMINTIIDEYRKSKLYKDNIEIKAMEQLAKIEVNDAQSELSEKQHDQLEQIKKKMKLLPPVTSKVFNLYAIDGYKHCEIASLLKISEGTSQWHYSIAKKKIREMILADQELMNERAS